VQLTVADDTVSVVELVPYRPTGQASIVVTHGPPAGPVKPVIQVHAELTELAAGETEPNGQFVQELAPEFEYESAGHE
jgi:hypothetical protein